MHKQLLLAVLPVLLAGPAAAQIYKTVGPDGKVIYSTTAPAAKTSSYSVLAPAKAGDIGSATSMPAAPVITRVNPKPVARPVVHASDAILSPDVVGAVANVVGMSHLVSRSRDFCMATVPGDMKRFSSASQAWEQRNSVVVAKKDKLMASSDRYLVASALSGDAARMTDDMMRWVKSAAPAEKTKWCEKAFADLDRGVLDLTGRPSIAPLMRYSSR